LLRETFSTLYKDAPPKFENQLSLEERKVLQGAAKVIRKFVSLEEGALTPAFFRRVPGIERAADRLLSRILPAQFTDIYIDVFEGYAPTGFPGLSVFEDIRSFPYLDFNVMSSLLTKLGLWRLLADKTPEGFPRFLKFRLHSSFPEFVRAKDRLLFALAHSNSGSVPRSAGIVGDLRVLRVKALEEDADPTNVAIEIYKASEELVKSAAGGLAMPDALSWKGQYLIVTATDLEDRVLQKSLDERGFSNPVIVNEERFSYVERFRSDVGRIFHLRTSAGSGGASGAFIMGKNAVDRLKPKFVISVGICFGLQEKKQQLGDVVISEMIHDYERQRVSKEQPEDRGATRESSPQLLSRARANLFIWKKANVHIGTIVSGEKLVDDEEFRATLIKLQPPAIAGEMEAWGLSAVCHEAQKQFIMVKGICDWGMKKDSDHQEQAAQNACDFALDALVVG
jgi:nucleoside phosphorylase